VILTLPPSINRLWRVAKNGKVYCSARYVQWRTLSVWQIASQLKSKKVVGPYKLTLLVVRPDKRKRDLDNLLKAASDALVAAGVLEDDKCEWIEARWVKGGPQCTIIIEELGEKLDGQTV
jgi:crossover junction endodeoxyribonuclease RusA